MSTLEKIENAVVEGYKKIEDGVVDSYKKYLKKLVNLTKQLNAIWH